MSSLKSAVKYFLAKIPNSVLSALVLALSYEVKNRYSEKLYDHTGGKVCEGPFKGSILLPETHGGAKQELFGQLVGVYESPVTQVLSERKWDTFIDIGAESGYYVAGMLVAGYSRDAYAFEMNNKSVEELNKRLTLNGVSAHIFGVATESSVSQLVSERKLNAEGTVILCDIEGGEFELFTSNLVQNINRCTVVIELHDSDEAKRPKLIETLSNHFEVQIRSRDEWKCQTLSNSIFSDLNDHEKMILMSEGREFLQHWLIARPKLRN